MIFPSFAAAVAEKQRLQGDLEIVFAEMKHYSQDYFRAAFEDVFARYPQIRRIVWHQYTPTWYDVDMSRHFQVTTANPVLNDDVCYYESRNRNPDMTAVQYDEFAADFRRIFEGLEPADMRRIFGEDVRVAVTRDGIQIDEEYHP